MGNEPGQPPGRGLDAREREILDFEREWWKFAGAKENAIRERFDLSSTRYYQVLNELIDRDEALEYDPMLVKRLREEYGDPTTSRPFRTPSQVIKRDSNREPFEPDKLTRSVIMAAEGCGAEAELRQLGSRVAFVVQDELKDQALVTSGQIASEALKELLRQNKLAYIRYASAVKRYQSVNDFWLDIYPLVEE
jgi:transcriptional regulator NrdR family protein